ncbi:AAA family ATPase [Lysobacter enzymogenes]|uniref:DNA helicase UvrD n=1 Tax=Lysobacter enzymogenes TaxID=69 RepID=A0A3N2RKI5_LYSEN|nr:AAA family ATPase [Lysobacter enzymogenes]ROU07881.1 DNA helicase UvrD [Lysobacter enzymogenes]
MDKSVVFAVAGAGKTTALVQKLTDGRRYLLVTYTDANRENLRRKIIERFGHFPSNVALYTYFKFLHGFCYRPFLRLEKNTKGIWFKPPPQFPRYPLTDDRRFITSGRRLYANRLAKFIAQTGTLPLALARVEKYFDALYVDEVQDFGGHDFDLLMQLAKANVDCFFVGDFYQHTYDTSRDGNVNARLHENYVGYRARFEAAGMQVDLESLQTSRRCSKTVCEFIAEKIGIEIRSASDRVTKVFYEDNAAKVQAIYENSSTVKLFLQEHHKYSCYSQNWGASKGADCYTDVCVVLNPPNVQAWKAGSFREINAETRNKLYVACSRARGDLIFVPQNLLKAYKTG